MTMNTNREPEELVIIGICSVCERGMVDDSSTDRHHWVPVVKGGKKGLLSKIHRICHQKIHSVWKEGELAKTYNNPETIKVAPEMQEFLAFLKNKAPNYYSSSRMNNRKRR